jgi:hypothetical protein
MYPLIINPFVVYTYLSTGILAKYSEYGKRILAMQSKFLAIQLICIAGNLPEIVLRLRQKLALNKCCH